MVEGEQRGELGGGGLGSGCCRVSLPRAVEGIAGVVPGGHRDKKQPSPQQLGIFEITRKPDVG